MFLVPKTVPVEILLVSKALPVEILLVLLKTFFLLSRGGGDPRVKGTPPPRSRPHWVADWRKPVTFRDKFVCSSI